MAIWIISLLAVLLFVTGTPILLIIGMWVAATSYFVVDYSMVSCGLFAAVSGSNSATAATIGSLLGPELKNRGIKPGLAASLVAAGGTVGVIIPPSVIFIVYGVTVNVSSFDLFLGGLIPGALLVSCLVASAVWLTRKVDLSEGLSSFKPLNIVKKGLEAWIGFVAIGVIFFGIY